MQLDIICKVIENFQNNGQVATFLLRKSDNLLLWSINGVEK